MGCIVVPSHVVPSVAVGVLYSVDLCFPAAFRCVHRTDKGDM